MIAVNILGEEPSNPLFKEGQIEELDLKSQRLSMCDDLSFSMYVEKGVADIIRTMESKKENAVKGLKYSY